MRGVVVVVVVVAVATSVKCLMLDVMQQIL